LTIQVAVNIIAPAEDKQERMRIAIHTLGCKLNQAESEHLAHQFADAGYTVVDGDEADVCVLNTCTVTHIADRKSRHLVRLLRKRNPAARVIVTGCYAERAPEELASAGADLVVGNAQKMHLTELVREKFDSASMSGRHDGNGLNRVRSFVKIQDGCKDGCAYCVVPSVRQRKYCVPVEEVIETVKARCAAGYKEVILTGTKIGSYHNNGADLGQLVWRILEETDIQRLHLSSLQPQEISPELLRSWQDKRLCRHFHLALQSGCASVLERMRRRYTLQDYRKAVIAIREMVPEVAITTDVMVGFPGECAEEFEEGYRFCQELGFADMHVFVYSPRPGTLAAKMQGQVDSRVKKERSLKMLDLARLSAQQFASRFVGSEATVLWENEVTSGSSVYSGLTDNYIRVFARSQKPLVNQIRPVRLVKVHKEGLWGEIVE
jgi:threonylcarbamoyladenosine tRNA methylthiotransferase MtaB